MVLGLPNTLWAHVFALAPHVGRTEFIAPELQFLELRHGDSQRLPDSPQPGLLRPLICACDLLREVSANNEDADTCSGRTLPSFSSHPLAASPRRVIAGHLPEARRSPVCLIPFQCLLREHLAH